MPEDRPLPEIVPVTPPDAEARLSRAIRQVRQRRMRRAGVALSAVAVLAVGSSVTALSLSGHGNKADQAATVTATSTPASTAPTTPPCPTSSPSSASAELGRTTVNNRTRATLAAVALTSTVAACGTTTPKPTSTPTTPGGAPRQSSSVAPTSSMPLPVSSSVGNATSSASAAGGPSPCATSALSASATEVTGAGGSRYAYVVLHNTSQETCTLTGYPGVSFVAAAGEQVSKPAQREAPSSDFGLGTRVLQPGGAASALLGWTNTLNPPASQCQPAQATGVRIYPPGQTAALFASLPTSVCTTTSHEPSITPLQSGSGA